MKYCVLIFVALMTGLGAQAQGLERVRWGLAMADSLNGARVEVVETPDAAAALSDLKWIEGGSKMLVYGVLLFSDNTQNARENARSVAGRFADIFPETVVEVSYESPHFKVTAGKYIDKIDAIALCGKALPHFTKAVVIQHEIANPTKQF